MRGQRSLQHGHLWSWPKYVPGTAGHRDIQGARQLWSLLSELTFKYKGHRKIGPSPVGSALKKAVKAVGNLSEK